MRISTYENFVYNVRQHVQAWFDWYDSMTEEERSVYFANRDKERVAECEYNKKMGYILEYNGIKYTEQDILDGKVPANGVLVNMGYKRNGSKWVKR